MSPALRPALVLLLVFAALSLGQGVHNALVYSGDLQWHEGRLFLLGINPYRAFLEEVDLIPLLGSRDLTEPVQLPSALVLFTVVGPLGHDGAKALWAAANILATLAFVYLLIETFGARPFSWALFGLLTAALIASTPWRITVGNGQHGVIAMALFMASLHAFKRGATVLSGGLLALAFLKYTLVLPFCALFLFDIRRTIAVLAVALAGHAALTALAAGLVDTPPLALAHQSLELAGRFVAAGWLDVFAVWQTWSGSPELLVPVHLGALVAAATVAAALRGGHDLRLAAIVAIASIIMFYHRMYDAFVLVVVLHDLIERHAPGLASEAPVRPRWWRSLELWLGALVIGYAFYFAKVVHVLHGRGTLSADAVAAIDLGFAVLTYGLFLHLVAEALQPARRRP